MYLRKLHIRNLKLLRDVAIDFTGEDGSPRPFTVLVGENGLCKTSLLQAIALAASGADRANQLAEAGSYLDLRRPGEGVDVEASFSFSESHHRARVYPGHEDIALARPPTLGTHLWIDPGFDVFRSASSYVYEGGGALSIKDELTAKNGKRAADLRRLPDPLSDARGRNLMHWFIAGYGVGRTLPAPVSITPEENASPSRDRLLSLFKVGRRIVGTGFADILPPLRAEGFSRRLQQAFVEHAILPHAKALSLRARGNINNAAERARAHHLTLALPGGDVDVPTIWLSQGYQAMMAWVADLVGQVWWEGDKQEIPLEEMEGICLVDEIDLHLHPQWQAGIIRALRAAFPKMQFIATTHSPMVLPGLRQEEIFHLRQDQEGNVVVRRAEESPALMTGSELYRRFFGIDRAQPRELHDKLFAYATLASYPGRSEAEEREVWKLLAKLRAAGADPGFEPEPRTIGTKKRRAFKKRSTGRRRAKYRIALPRP